MRIYKPGQGRWMRIGTAVGAGVLVVSGAVFLLGVLGNAMDQNTTYYLPVQYGSAVGFLVIAGAVLYWVVGLNRKANDFFIATEGEMKKVSWSTREDIVRSTKVVIVTVVLMATLLFVADLLFMLFFVAVGVLRTGRTVGEMLGIG